MNENNKYTFDVYRFQLLPTSKVIQTRIDDPHLTYDKLVEKKNKIFEKIVLSKSMTFKGKSSEVIHSSNKIGSDYISLHFGIPRKDVIEKEDFTKEEIQRYPDLKIFINNNPFEQLIFIQRNYKAISKTESIVRLLERNLLKYLANYQLAIYIQPLYTEIEFWDLVNKYNKRITRLIFEFIKPNLSNISGGLAEDLKQFQGDSNAHKGKLELEAPKKGALEIDAASIEIKGLVNYSAKGGGDISVKVKGLRKKIKTSKGTKTIEIDEAILNNPNSEILDSLFSNLK